MKYSTVQLLFMDQIRSPKEPKRPEWNHSDAFHEPSAFSKRLLGGFSSPDLTQRRTKRSPLPGFNCTRTQRMSSEAQKGMGRNVTMRVEKEIAFYFRSPPDQSVSVSRSAMAHGGSTSAWRLLLWGLALSCVFASDTNSTSSSSSSSSGSSSGSSFEDTEVIVPRVGPTTTQKSEDLNIPVPKIITLAVLGCLGIFVVVALLVAMRKFRSGAWVNRYDSDVEQLESVTPTTNRPHHDYY